MLIQKLSFWEPVITFEETDGRRRDIPLLFSETVLEKRKLY